MTESTNSEGQETRPEPAPVIESEKPACDLTFFSEANKFAENAIKNIPELHGVAIIPLWMPQLQDVPPGILRLRNETPPYIPALMQLLGKISEFSINVHRDMNTQFRAYNQMAHDIAAEVKNKVEELRVINEKLNAAEQNKQ